MSNTNGFLSHVMNSVLLLAMIVSILSVPVSPVYGAAISMAPAAGEETHLTDALGDKPNPYFAVEIITLDDGTQLERLIINGPPSPPPGYELERAPVSWKEIEQLTAAVTLPVPTYSWVFGCSAVSAAMVAAYFDRTIAPNLYTGPANGGVMPLTNSTWGTWSDGHDTYPANPLVASRQGLDGRTTRGSIDDYWVRYGSTAADPYITGGWAQHTWGSAVGDYMKTSQSTYANTDGATSFYHYFSSLKLFCDDMPGQGIQDDGTYGRRQFYQARGYSVTDCYNQNTDNRYSGGFSFSDYKAKINAGQPVLLNLEGHSVVGVGYNDSTTPGTVYLHDTWDFQIHSMSWGGSYSGMVLLSVSITDLVIDSAPPATTASLSGTVGENGWYRSNVQVMLSASDNAGGTGVKLIQYKIDDGTWRTYSGSFAVSGEGRHTVYYKAQDNAGNWEAEKQVAVKIDSTAPTGSLILAGGATSTPGVVVTISPSASDATSGVGQMRLRDAGMTWSDWRSYTTRLLWQLPATTGSTYSVEVQYKDTAGNISATYNDGISLNIYPNRPQSSGYRLARSTWGVAPWDRQSANYRLQGTAGQVSLVGRISSSNYGLISGFWLGTPPQLRVYLPLVLR